MSREDENRRKSRAKLWREFRAEFLLSQKNLAELLGCSRRTTQYVEQGIVKPNQRIIAAFGDLYKKYHAEKRNQAMKTLRAGKGFRNDAYTPQ